MIALVKDLDRMKLIRVGLFVVESSMALVLDHSVAIMIVGESEGIYRMASMKDEDRKEGQSSRSSAKS